MNRTSGYTLIELLVSLAVGAILLGGVFALSSGALRTSSGMAQATQSTVSLSHLLDFAEGRLRKGAFVAVEKGDRRAVSVLYHREALGRIPVSYKANFATSRTLTLKEDAPLNPGDLVLLRNSAGDGILFELSAVTRGGGGTVLTHGECGNTLSGQNAEVLPLERLDLALGSALGSGYSADTLYQQDRRKGAAPGFVPLSLGVAPFKIDYVYKSASGDRAINPTPTGGFSAAYPRMEVKKGSERYTLVGLGLTAGKALGGEGERQYARYVSLGGGVSSLSAASGSVQRLLSCGDTTPSPTTRGGMLYVDISGLPGGAAGDVTVSGPSLSGERLTASRGFDNLNTGIYTATAGDVTVRPNPRELYRAALSGNPATVNRWNIATVYARYTRVPGNLQLNLIGLPPGIPANLALSGPENYAATVDASRTLSVAPGFYDATPSVVWSGPVAYETDPQRQIPVPSDETTSRVFTYRPVPGVLDVEISGLPGGVNADVQLQPNGDRLSASRRFAEYPAGYHDARVNEVRQGGAVYAGSGAAFTVRSQAETRLSLRYAPVPGTVRVELDPATTQSGAEAALEVRIGTSSGSVGTRSLPPGNYPVTARFTSPVGTPACTPQTAGDIEVRSREESVLRVTLSCPPAPVTTLRVRVDGPAAIQSQIATAVTLAGPGFTSEKPGVTGGAYKSYTVSPGTFTLSGPDLTEGGKTYTGGSQSLTLASGQTGDLTLVYTEPGSGGPGPGPGSDPQVEVVIRGLVGTGMEHQTQVQVVASQPALINTGMVGNSTHSAKPLLTTYSASARVPVGYRLGFTISRNGSQVNQWRSGIQGSTTSLPLDGFTVASGDRWKLELDFARPVAPQLTVTLCGLPDGVQAPYTVGIEGRTPLGGGSTNGTLEYTLPMNSTYQAKFTVAAGFRVEVQASMNGAMVSQSTRTEGFTVTVAPALPSDRYAVRVCYTQTSAMLRLRSRYIEQGNDVTSSYGGDLPQYDVRTTLGTTTITGTGEVMVPVGTDYTIVPKTRAVRWWSKTFGADFLDTDGNPPSRTARMTGVGADAVYGYVHTGGGTGGGGGCSGGGSGYTNCFVSVNVRFVWSQDPLFGLWSYGAVRDVCGQQYSIKHNFDRVSFPSGEVRTRTVDATYPVLREGGGPDDGIGYVSYQYNEILHEIGLTDPMPSVRDVETEDRCI